MKRLSRPKLVFWLRWFEALEYVVAFLIIFLVVYLTHVFSGSFLTTTRVVKDGVNQVYTGGRGTDCYSTRLLITTISSSFSKISIRGLGSCSYQGSELTVSQHSLFFFMRLRGFLFIIGLTAFPIVSIHLSNAGWGLKSRLRLGLDSFIEHFIQGVKFLMSIIHLGLNRESEAIMKTPDQYFLVKSRNGVKLLEHSL